MSKFFMRIYKLFLLSDTVSMDTSSQSLSQSGVPEHTLSGRKRKPEYFLLDPKGNTPVLHLY